MAREYGRIHTTFWTSPTTGDLPDDAKLLAAYLLSCSHGTIIGAFRLPAAYACDDLKWLPKQFAKAFETLSKAGFAIYCQRSQWVCLVKYLEWNPAENPNQQKAIDRALAALPDTCFAEGLRNGSPTVTKQGTGTGTGTGTGEGKGTVPSRPRKSEATLPAWLESLGEAEAIPPDDPVFEYAASIGLPADFLLLCWREFESRHSETDKRYKDWRAVFRKCVRANWYRLWWESPDGWALTTAGAQARKAAA